MATKQQKLDAIIEVANSWRNPDYAPHANNSICELTKFDCDSCIVGKVFGNDPGPIANVFWPVACTPIVVGTDNHALLSLALLHTIVEGQ